MVQKTVLGVFSDRDDAEDAIASLEQQDYNPKEISIIMKDQNEGADFARSTGTNVAGGAVTGATTGAVVGGIAGLLIGVGAIAIPGLGALLIGGPLAAALGLTGAAATTASGAVTGAVAGGLIGALMGLGIPEQDARVYADRVQAGGILVAVPARLGEEEEVADLLDDNGADTIRTLTLRDTYQEGDEDTDEDTDIVDAPEYESHRHTYHHTGEPVMAASGRKGGRSTTSSRRRRQRVDTK